VSQNRGFVEALAKVDSRVAEERADSDPVDACLRLSESGVFRLNSLDLRTSSKKRTILLDCCRKVVPRELLEKAELKAAYAFAEPELSRQACRRVFDEQILRCSNGIVVGYGCSPDQVDAGHPTKGGYYSSSLIDAAFSWFEGKKTGWRIVPDQRSIVSIQADAIPKITRLSGGTQAPMMEKPRTEPYFPFAVVA